MFIFFNGDSTWLYDIGKDNTTLPRSMSLGASQFQSDALANNQLNQNNRSVSAPNLGQSGRLIWLASCIMIVMICLIDGW